MATQSPTNNSASWPWCWRSYAQKLHNGSKAFQQNIKGIVFYSVPHTTSEKECVDYWKSYPDKHISRLLLLFPKQSSQNMVSLNVGFEKSIEQLHINLFAFVEGQKVQSCGYLSSFGGFSSLGQTLVS